MDGPVGSGQPGWDCLSGNHGIYTVKCDWLESRHVSQEADLVAGCRFGENDHLLPVRHGATNMRIRSKLKSVELDMTPMIDMVFLLIVFFTLVLNFAAADQNERIKLPISELAMPLPPTESITLHILSSGRIVYNGVEYSLQEFKQQEGQGTVKHYLRTLKHMNVPVDENGCFKITVIIRADAQCASEHVLDVVEWCRDSNLSRLVFRTKQQEK